MALGEAINKVIQYFFRKKKGTLKEKLHEV